MQNLSILYLVSVAKQAGLGHTCQNAPPNVIGHSVLRGHGCPGYRVQGVQRARGTPVIRHSVPRWQGVPRLFYRAQGAPVMEMMCTSLGNTNNSMEGHEVSLVRHDVSRFWGH